MLFEDSKLVRVIAEPHQISVGLWEQALEPRVVREFFDDERLAHSGIISGLMNPVKQFRLDKVSSRLTARTTDRLNLVASDRDGFQVEETEELEPSHLGSGLLRFVSCMIAAGSHPDRITRSSP
jgi:hypothetical protein